MSRGTVHAQDHTAGIKQSRQRKEQAQDLLGLSEARGKLDTSPDSERREGKCLGDLSRVDPLFPSRRFSSLTAFIGQGNFAGYPAPVDSYAHN